MQQHLFEHFSSESHSGFLDDVSIIFIDKADPKGPNKLEHYWRHTLKTVDLNEEDNRFLQFCCLICPILFIVMNACIRTFQFG